MFYQRHSAGSQFVRNRLQRCSIKKGVIQIFANFTRKHVLYSILNKVAGPKRLQHRGGGSLRKKSFKNICERLLLIRLLSWKQVQKSWLMRRNMVCCFSKETLCKWKQFFFPENTQNSIRLLTYYEHKENKFY